MTEKSSSFQIAWIQGAIGLSMIIFVVIAFQNIASDPNLRDDQFAPTLIILVAAAAFTRRYGIPLPGKGFSSFLFATVWAGLFLQNMHFAVLIAAIGTPAGDSIFRHLRLRAVFNNIGHIVLGTGMVGLLYSAMGGQHGAAAIGSDNLGPMLTAIIALPVIVNGTFYLEHALSTGVAWVDAKLTLRWELVTAFFSAAIALATVSLATAPLDAVTRTIWAAILVPGIGIVLLVVKQAVSADELRLVQGMADAVAADVSIDRSFARIQELTKLLVPWEQMGFARFDAKAGEMELLADTGTTDRLRFPANAGLTGEAIRSGEAVVSNASNRNEMILPEGENPGSEVLIPLYHGGRLVGLWSIRHPDATMYRPADATLLNVLAPQLALVLALSEILTPMLESTENAASSMVELREAHLSIREAARAVDQSVGKTKDESNRAARRVQSASETIRRLSAGIDGALSSAQAAVQAIRATADEAADLRQSTGEAVTKLRELSITIQQGAADVVKLRDAATEVEGFSQSIGGIANQTNLLALNATIESARAGVHGKGFRVVAEEVRKLADESGREARKIGRSAQKTRRVIDESAQLLEGLDREVSELAAASELWRVRLAAIVETAEKSRRAGEQMVRFPEENRKVADDALEMLTQAETAATASAEQALVVASSGAEQLQGIDQLARGLEALERLTTQLQEGAKFISGADDKNE